MRWLAFACVFGAAHAHARSFVVTANEDMTFTPAQLEIYQGDSVRFVNAGGLHNVRADDGSFTCALDCNLHNAPSIASSSTDSTPPRPRNGDAVHIVDYVAAPPRYAPAPCPYAPRAALGAARASDDACS
jgi:plastocyanin